ncbi:MAG: GIY-YIG nuclease family protein [Gammaproteobacteria bacterium]|nr:GIY-YIG nuclease family protein [Gammaproteobacteria bacterium]
MTKFSLVPEQSGVYAFCRVSRSNGLPFELNVVYIGRAKNLRRRFREHMNPMTEHNWQLFNALKGSAIEFWYTEADDIEPLEKALIQVIDPDFNQRIG